MGVLGIESNLTSDRKFWQVWLGCIAGYTTIPEVARLYDVTPQSFYGEDGIVAAMVDDGALFEARRLKTAYRTDVDYNSDIPWSEVLEPAYLFFFDHRWLKLLTDTEHLATRPEEVYRTIRARIVNSIENAASAITRNDIEMEIRTAASPVVSPEFHYPAYIHEPSLFDVMLRLRALLHMRYGIQNRKDEFHQRCVDMDDAMAAHLEEDDYERECIELALSGFGEFGIDENAKERIGEQIMPRLH